MSVFRKQSFTYKGETLELTPDLALLRKIKARGINNVLLANRCIKGGVDLEDLAIVHTEFLRAAGWDRPETDGETGRKITEEESYGFLTMGGAREIMLFQQAYVQAVLPAVDFGKKPAPQGTKSSKRKPRARKAKS